MCFKTYQKININIKLTFYVVTKSKLITFILIAA